MIWQTSRFEVRLTRPQIMAIVNLTPDSFSDGGALTRVSEALRYCEQAIQDGAALLDLGAESTRPGADPVTQAMELDRLLPVLREAVKLGVPISVDTYKPAVMQAALDLGCDIINDVWALRQSDASTTALEVVTKHPRCGVILMHMRGEPKTMQRHLGKTSADSEVFLEVRDFLSERSQALRKAGVSATRIAWDVGIGFGKTVAQNFELLAKQIALVSLGYPLVCGWSRKSSLGEVCGIPAPQDRVIASVAAALLAAERGARILRVHDVKATQEALCVWQAAKRRVS